MELIDTTNFRMIEQDEVVIPCYFYGLFKSPGLAKYPKYDWVNCDYDLIKSKTLDEENCRRIANNFFQVGEKFNLFSDLDYFVMMPLKSTSVSSLSQVIVHLISLIETKWDRKVRLINDLFHVADYRKFWENRLKLVERKQEIANKITLTEKYHHWFDGKKVIVIDDIVATGTSISKIVKLIKEFNHLHAVSALAYGSVYQWEKIYS